MNIQGLFKKESDGRREFILSCCNISALILSLAYFILLLWGYLTLGNDYNGFKPILGIIIIGLLTTSYMLNKHQYIKLSLFILSATLITLCTYAGIKWGFDLPSTLLGYVLSITIVTVAGTRRQNQLNFLLIILIIIFGQIFREISEQNLTWHTTNFGFNDVIEVSIILSTIALLLFLSQRFQSNLLDRAKRSESILLLERKDIEGKIEQKVQELKTMQMENISSMNRFVEFGKLASGLFHDLMSPVQTLKLHIELLAKERTDDHIKQQMSNIKFVSEKIESMLEGMRKQIKFNHTLESFDLLQEIKDILNITRHLYLHNKVGIEIKCETDTYFITEKRIILNHVLLNLISNAFEACRPEKHNQLLIDVGDHRYGHFTKYISIIDNGMGISKHNLQNIFDSFFSTKHGNKLRSTNCGIGLSSSKFAIEKYLNGRLFVESEEGKGTTMTILL